MSVPGRTLFNPAGGPPPSNKPSTLNLNLYSEIPASILVSFPSILPQFKHTSLFSVKGLLPGHYTLRLYSPTEILNTFLTLYSIHPLGWTSKPAKTKAEVEEQNRQILGFAISSTLNPIGVSSAHVISGPMSRISSLPLNNIQPDSLSKLGVNIALAFKTDDIAIYHSLNTFTLLTLTSIPRRLTDILTAL